MKVGQRLFLAVVPAVLGLFLVAALAYWGRYARSAPELVIILAAVAAIASLVVSWRNTRYVVHRVQRLAGQTISIEGERSTSTPETRRDALRDLGIQLPGAQKGDTAHGVDELDHIEATVAGLSTAVARAREDATRQSREALERAKEIEQLLQSVTARFAARTQEAQLPLHILLSSPFGELNENQEEMLGAAMSAVDAIDTEVRQLRKLVQLHRGELSIVTQPINLAELLRPTLAIAAARAESAHVQLRPSVSDTAPRAFVDAVHAQEALTTILIDAIAHTAEGGDVDVAAGEREGERQRIRISITRNPVLPGTGDPAPLEMRLARRLLEAQGCSITIDGAVTIVDLPSESASPVTR
jgi:signal transduction histidine kinase